MDGTAQTMKTAIKVNMPTTPYKSLKNPTMQATMKTQM